MKKTLNLIILLGSLISVLALAYLGYQVLTEHRTAENFVTLAPTEAATQGTAPQGTATQGTATAGQATESAGQTRYLAPDFTVYDAQGNAHKLSDFRGKPVVLNFWASWCTVCTGEMPNFQSAYDARGQEVQFLMINLTDNYQETLDSAQSFLTETGYQFPVYYDTDLSAASAYQVSGIPVTFFIDADGYLAAYASGALGAEGLAKGILVITQ